MVSQKLRLNVEAPGQALVTPGPSSAAASNEEAEPKKVIMSKAARRKLKKAPSVVTAEMKEAAREELRALRKHLRMVKSNGGRRKLAKLDAKRARDDDDNDDDQESRVRRNIEAAASALDEDARPIKKGRRLELVSSKEWVPPVQTLPDSMLPKPVSVAEDTPPAPPAAAVTESRKRQEHKGRHNDDGLGAMEAFAKERRTRNRDENEGDI